MATLTHHQGNWKVCISPKSGNAGSAIATIRRFAHTAETALHTAEIKSIELADVRLEYVGKKAAPTDRRVITKASYRWRLGNENQRRERGAGWREGTIGRGVDTGCENEWERRGTSS